LVWWLKIIGGFTVWWILLTSGIGLVESDLVDLLEWWNQYSDLLNGADKYFGGINTVVWWNQDSSLLNGADKWN
jgi:hypothetical protein